MKRVVNVLGMLLVAAGLDGCGTGGVLAAVEDCDGFRGSFVATDLGFTGLADPTLVENFAGGALTLQLGEGVFDSEFTLPGVAPLRVTGPFSVLGSEVVLGTTPLLPRAAAGEQRFTCRVVDGDSFTLVGNPVGFDFDGDGVFETAVFEADFDAI